MPEWKCWDQACRARQDELLEAICYDSASHFLFEAIRYSASHFLFEAICYSASHLLFQLFRVLRQIPCIFLE